MKSNRKEIIGPWDMGFVLDKHTIWSTCTGHNEQGHPTFDTLRSDVGEALFRLKYRQDWSQVDPLANELAAVICPLFKNVGLIVPMPPSKPRARQPVFEVATALGRKLNVPVFDDILRKGAGDQQLKNLNNKSEKLDALRSRFTINDQISTDGRWNALLVDDLFDSGASAEAACMALREYKKIGKIYVAALTWK